MASSGEATEPGAPAALADALARLDRDNLAVHVERVLNRGGMGNPDVLLVRVGEERLVVKDFASRGPLVRTLLGRWATARELAAYRRLTGVEAVPRAVGRLDPLALALEYRPGRMLTRSLAPELPTGFLAELLQAVDAMHARRVVHLDLRHRSNILVDPRGRPVLLDFASAIRLPRHGRLGAWLTRCLGWVDRRALHKWRARLTPPAAVQSQASATAASAVGEAEATSGATSASSRGASRPM